MKYIKTYKLFEDVEEINDEETDIEIMNMTGDAGFNITENDFLELLDLGLVDYDDRFKDELYQEIEDYLNMKHDANKYNL